MSKKKIAIRFKSLYYLWQFAQNIQSGTMEIRAQEQLLICDCSEGELLSLVKYKGEIVEDFELTKVPAKSFSGTRALN